MARKPQSGRGRTRKPARARAAQAGLATLAPPSELGLRSIPTAEAKPKIAATAKVKVASAALPAPVGAKGANTIVYIHGIANKPVASVLKCQWDNALFGTQLGDRSRMAYWVNRDRYPIPLDETCASSDTVKVAANVAVGPDTMATTLAANPAEALAGQTSDIIASEIGDLTGDPARQALLAGIARKTIATASIDKASIETRMRAEAVPGTVSALDIQAKILPVPEFLRKLIARELTKAFLADVNDFLYDAKRRDDMEQAFLDRLNAGGGPFVVVAHSQGTLIAYDVLRRLDPKTIEVPLFVTVGSPLGIQEVQDALRKWGGGKFPYPACVGRWVNVADHLDPVAADPDISNDIDPPKGKTIENTARFFLNPDSWRHPHSATGYLQTDEVRKPVRQTVGATFEQSIASFAIAKDLVGDLEDGHREKRHEVLIQLASDRPGNTASPQALDEVEAKVRKLLDEIVKSEPPAVGKPECERLRHFLVAQLNRLEVEALRSSFKDLQIEGIWRDAAKRSLIKDSTHTIQARPANLGYGADGHGICWGVLDTGIRADHPHFKKNANVAKQWDCTKSGAPVAYAPGDKGFGSLDGHGHGTHVSGIIAGECGVTMPGVPDPVPFAGMAPRCSLFGFKVLDDAGNGKDSWIIKALDKVAELNDAAGRIVVHGINLSLGGNFDPSVFGCGQTPLCQELRRLWRQGVLVCLAAGNEGYAVLAATTGDVPANMDLSIGDPANLEEAIAVGSVHKTNPHTYGVSYFSSRGPTADGRRKPDVVAPGEKIISARHDWPSQTPDKPAAIESHYVEMSGTSMATPHVSGLLAAFLSLRREFIGYPDRVKAMLLDGCVDLRRDVYMQGAGLPNLIKMLALN